MSQQDDESLRKFDIFDNKVKAVIQDYIPKAKMI